MRTRQRVSARRTVEARYTPGRASDFIDPLQVVRGHRYVLACRVSTRWQEDNLSSQETCLRRAVEAGGGIVVAQTQTASSGTEPGWLLEALRAAELHDATVVAATVNRLIRNPAYSRKIHAEPRTADLAELARWTDGVPLATLLHPDASDNEQRGYLSKLGQQEKGKTGGRPPAKKPGYKKRRRECLVAHAVAMRQVGMSLREIARELREIAARELDEELAIPLTTTRRWVEGVPFLQGSTDITEA